ncbi:hypothetical protein SETIT_3G186800v2 [Setaria italica]|uniref:Uncharacterized protein n=1 Tax=Setaria italica TaxID=4555 RepID=A0A368QGC4_SETIT|nr:hypothetical protein SETIT_3G186800v2 [Setaria italica]
MRTPNAKAQGRCPTANARARRRKPSRQRAAARDAVRAVGRKSGACGSRGLLPPQAMMPARGCRGRRPGRGEEAQPPAYTRQPWTSTAAASRPLAGKTSAAASTEEHPRGPKATAQRSSAPAPGSTRIWSWEVGFGVWWLETTPTGYEERPRDQGDLEWGRRRGGRKEESTRGRLRPRLAPPLPPFAGRRPAALGFGEWRRVWAGAPDAKEGDVGIKLTRACRCHVDVICMGRCVDVDEVGLNLHQIRSLLLLVGKDLDVDDEQQPP